MESHLLLLLMTAQRRADDSELEAFTLPLPNGRIVGCSHGLQPDAYDSFKRDLGVRVSKLRTELGTSQRKFAIMLELDCVTLNRIEAGRGNPTLDTLSRIAQGLDVDIAELLGDR